MTVHLPQGPTGRLACCHRYPRDVPAEDQIGYDGTVATCSRPTCAHCTRPIGEHLRVTMAPGDSSSRIRLHEWYRVCPEALGTVKTVMAGAKHYEERAHDND